MFWQAAAAQIDLVPWDLLRAYLAKHPEMVVVYERGDKGYVIDRVFDYPELVTSPPLLARKLLAMRAVDGTNPDARTFSCRLCNFAPHPNCGSTAIETSAS